MPRLDSLHRGMSDDQPKAALGAAVASLLEVPVLVQQLWQRLEHTETRLLARIGELQDQLAELQRQLPPVMKRRDEAAKWLGVSERTVDRMIDEGLLPTVRVGRVVLCDVTKLRPADTEAASKRVVLGE